MLRQILCCKPSKIVLPATVRVGQVTRQERSGSMVPRYGGGTFSTGRGQVQIDGQIYDRRFAYRSLRTEELETVRKFERSYLMPFDSFSA